MSSHTVTNSPDFHSTPKFVGHSPDDPDGLDIKLGEDSDLGIKIYRKNGSEVRLFYELAVIVSMRGDGDRSRLQTNLFFNFIWVSGKLISS